MSSMMSWGPFRNISNLQEQMNRLFEDSRRNGRAESSALTTWSPPVDIHETENELIVEADLPGMNENDLDIRVENNMLTIAGERKFQSEVKEDDYLRIERTYGSFNRSFGLPSAVNAEAIKAEYKNGVLTLELPKRDEAKPRQVKINVNRGT
jgi:HSP20 family protein